MAKRVNIVNPKEIGNYLERHADAHTETTRLLKITLLASLKRREESAAELTALPEDAPEWLVNKWDVGGPFHVFEPDAALFDKVRHVKDWLVAAQRNGAEFLQDVDEKGRPRKLVQLDLDGAYNAADKYFKQLNQSFRKAAEDDRDTKTVMTFDGGYRVVQLLTPDALRAEGPQMGHCIGGGAYDDGLVSGSHAYYSLRDAANKPHATFEVWTQENILLQCKGKQNEPPVEKYMPMVQAFLTERKFKLQEGFRFTGLMQDAEGGYHAFRSYPMPQELSRLQDADSDLLYSGSDPEPWKQISLPDKMSVRGILHLSHWEDLKDLPKALCVDRHFNLDGCTGLTEVHFDEALVGGVMNMKDCTGLTRLSGNIFVDGFLNLRGCTNLTEMSGHVAVGGQVVLNASRKLRSLPEKLAVRDELHLSCCESLTALPENLWVERDLYINGCTSLSALPDNVYVGQNLYANHSGLTTLPPGFHVEENIILANCQSLLSLPRGLRVPRNLNLEGCSALASLPEGLSVGGTLRLEGCRSLRALPEGLSVRGDLILKDCTALKTLPKRFSVGGKIILSGCSRLTRLPEHLQLGWRIDLTGCSALTSLPDNFYDRHPGSICLRGCKSLTALPGQLSVYDEMDLAGCSGLKSLPEKLCVGGDLDLTGCTGLKSLPRDLRVHGRILTDFGVFNVEWAAVDAFEKRFNERFSMASKIKKRLGFGR